MYATCEVTSLSTRARNWQAAERLAMLKTRECYEHAAEASSRAKRTEQAAVRKAYFELERQWLRLARSYEVSEQVTDFTGELTRPLHALRQIPAGIPRVVCPTRGKKMRLTLLEPSRPRH